MARCQKAWRTPHTEHGGRGQLGSPMVYRSPPCSLAAPPHASARLRTPARTPPRRPGQPAGAGAPRPGPSPEIFGLLRAIRPPGPGGRPRGVRTPDDTLHRPLARRPGCRLVPACGKQEVDARRSADGQARSGGCWVKALHRSHLEAGDVTGAADLVRNPRPGAPSAWSRAASFVGACENQRTRRARIC